MECKKNIQFFKDIFESIRDCVIVVSSDLLILEYNQGAQKLCNISKTVSDSLTLDEIFSSNKYLIELTNKTLASNCPYICSDYEFFQRKNLCHTPVNVSISPLLDSNTKDLGAVIVLQDISTLKELQDDNKRHDKLASVNSLAHVMAHEIKNPLSGIKGASQLLRDDVGEKGIKYVDLIISDVERINDIIGKLLYAASPPKPSFTSVNIHKVLENILLLEKETQIGKKITVIQNYDPSIPGIQADLGQIHQVFLNIIKNAFESMENKGGRLYLTTKIIIDYHLYPVKENTPQSSLVLIEIKDTGCGIKEDMQKDIFIPFYTTKKNGTGLGLAISSKIVEEHGGKMKIENNQGAAGVRVCIYLPLQKGKN